MLVEQFPSEIIMVIIVLDNIRTIQNHPSDSISSPFSQEDKVEVWEVQDAWITDDVSNWPIENMHAL